MDKSELFLGVRKKNGQIGYISEGLNIPEFFELLQPSNNGLKILVDYSPVIEKLHEIHKRHNDEVILNSYNSLYNYWLDARTYNEKSLKISKSEELTKLSNSLINELQLRLQKKQLEFYSAGNNQLSILKSIKSEGDIYIDTLLCFIHSKASLEITSFKKDTVINSYADFLYKQIKGLFEHITSTGRNDSFFKYIAFERPNELESYLNLSSIKETKNEFLLRTLKSEKPQEQWDEYQGNIKQVKIQYVNFDRTHLSMAEILRDLFHKINSIREMIALLRAGNVEWDESDEAVKALEELMDKK